MLQSYISTFKKSFDFGGRATRSEYWIFYVGNLLVMLSLFFMLALLSQTNKVFPLAMIAIYAVIVAVPAVSVSVRRLHDANMSGWWWFINIVPYIGGVIFIIFMLLPSVHEGNRYGTVDLVSSATPFDDKEKEVVAVIEEESHPTAQASGEKV